MILFPRNLARPASPARLRAMARQIARPMQHDLGESDGFDEMMDATFCLTLDDQRTLRGMVAAIVGDARYDAAMEDRRS